MESLKHKKTIKTKTEHYKNYNLITIKQLKAIKII